jgi:hypothetical protein
MKQQLLSVAFLGALFTAMPALAQSSPVEKTLAEGGPFVSTGNTVQNFSAPIAVDTKDVAPLTFTFTNGPNNAAKFAWVRVFLSNENSSSSGGKAGTPNGVMIMTEKNLQNGRFDMDMTGRLRGGRNIVYVTGAGFKGSTVSWKLSTVLSSLKLTAVNPNVTQPGGTVSLTGIGFGATAADNAVYFDKTKVKVKSASGTTMQVEVPADIKTGNYQLQITVGSNRSNPVGITVKGQPEVTGSDWKAGPALQVVTIYGKGFSPVASDNVVMFGGVKATVSTATTDSIVTTVPYIPDLGGASCYLTPTATDITVTVGGVPAKGKAPFMSTLKGWQ